MPALVPSLAALLLHCAPQDPVEALNVLVVDPRLADARVGVHVVDLADGTVVCGHDADRGFMTASNMKLVSAAVALRTLGTDFRFRTTLVGTGPLTDGVLDGDLVLVGSGDPTFGGRSEGDDPRAALIRMVDAAIDKHGLRRVTGDVLGDDACQPDEVMGEGWSWNYQGDAYAAQVSGLCFAENCALIGAIAGDDGAAPVVTTLPRTSYLTIQNGAICATGLERSSIWAERTRATNLVRLGGRLPVGARPWNTRISVENPTAYAATVLLEVLRERGVEVVGQALDRDERPPRPERYGDEFELATHESAPLGDILVVLCKVSQNLYAEQLIRAAARQARGDASMSSAAVHAKETLRTLGVDPTGMRIADGSGLSRLNQVRPRQLADLLAGVWRSELREPFFRSLPIAGVDGTLASRFKDGPATNRVLAKTGYVSGVVALSGIVPRAGDAPPLAFSILVNNFTCRNDDTKAAVDRFVESLVSWANRATRDD